MNCVHKVRSRVSAKDVGVVKVVNGVRVTGEKKHCDGSGKVERGFRTSRNVEING